MAKRKVIFTSIILVSYLFSLAVLLRVSEIWPMSNPDRRSTPNKEIQVERVQDYLEEIVSPEVIPQPISIEKIFDGIDEDTAHPDNWSMIVGGDIMIGRTVNYKTLSYNNFDWPYMNITELLIGADFAFANLESPVVVNCPVRNDGMIFCGDVNHITGMRNAGIDAVSLANNHTLNQGKTGLETTLAYLNQNNITAVGVTNPSYVEIKGQRVALLAYTDIECYPGIECVDPEKIKSDISAAVNESDLVIIMFHWGAEYRDYPTQRQKDLAYLSIDAGADLILGNHPHWIQPFEIYKGKLIMYSHGNLIFDQMWSQKTREGVLAEYIFNKSTLIDVKIYPVVIEDYGQPRLMEDPYKSSKIQFIKALSENLSTGAY